MSATESRPLVLNTILHILYLLLLIAVSSEAIELCSPWLLHDDIIWCWFWCSLMYNTGRSGLLMISLMQWYCQIQLKFQASFSRCSRACEWHFWFCRWLPLKQRSLTETVFFSIRKLTQEGLACFDDPRRLLCFKEISVGVSDKSSIDLTVSWEGLLESSHTSLVGASETGTIIVRV